MSRLKFYTIYINNFNPLFLMKTGDSKANDVF